MTYVGRWLGLIALLAPAALASVGCGDDGEDAAPDGADMDAAVPGNTMDSGASGDGATSIDAALGRTYYWTDWVTIRRGDDGGVEGTLTLPTGALAITYSGQFYGAQVDGGMEIWTPESPYLSAAVGNGPRGSDVVMIEGGNDVPLIVRFARPVVDPVIAFYSLGNLQKEAYNQFELPFELVSSGAGLYGNAPLRQDPGNKLAGRESYGTIRFKGTYSTLRWTAPVGEQWHGFTVGIPEVAAEDAGITP
jgi:hypothetical protein